MSEPTKGDVMAEERDKKTPHGFHQWVQTAAALLSVSAVAGGAITGLFQNHSLRIAAAVICAGVVCFGAYKRKWLLVAAPLLGMVALIALIPIQAAEPSGQPQASQSSNQPRQSTGQSAATLGSSPTVKQEAGAPEPLATFDVELKPHDAADIDKPSGAVISRGQSGATGANDVYLYDHAVASPRIYISNSQSLIYAESATADAYDTCKSQLDPSSSASRHGWSSVSIEVKMCFYTSDKNMAYAAITGVDHPSGAAEPRAITLHVIVWAKE